MLLNRVGRGGGALTFIALAALGGLLVYAVALKQGHSPSVAWYWLLIAVIDGAVLLQILSRVGRAQPQGAWAVLAQIVALKVLLSLMVVWTAPHGLFGFDPHFNLSATEAVGRWGWPVPDDAGLLTYTLSYSRWPSTDFLNLTASDVSGLSSLQLARYLPGAVGTLSVVFMFVAGKRMFGSGESGLLGALGTAHITTAVTFQAKYVREAFAFPLLMGLVALLVKGRLDAKDRTLAIVLLGAIVLYHHLTAFMALLLLGSMALVHWVLSLVKFPLGNHASDGAIQQRAESLRALAVFHMIVFLAYAVYIGPGIIEDIAQGVRNLLVAGGGSSPYVGVQRDAVRQFVYYGRWVITAVMGMTLLGYLTYHTLRRKWPGWHTMGLSLFLWIVAVGSWTIASNYGGVLLGADPTRLLTFGYPFLLLIFAQVAVLGVRSAGLRSRALAHLATAVVVVFLVVNLLGMPRYVYQAGAEPDYAAGQVSRVYPAALYAANDWQAKAIAPGAVLAGDWTTWEIFGGLSQRQVAVDPDFYQTGGSSGHYDGFVVRQEMSRLSYFSKVSGGYRFFPLQEEQLNALLQRPDSQLVYDNGDTRIVVSP